MPATSADAADGYGYEVRDKAIGALTLLMGGLVPATPRFCE
jgi:hypothetical protein